MNEFNIFFTLKKAQSLPLEKSHSMKMIFGAVLQNVAGGTASGSVGADSFHNNN